MIILKVNHVVFPQYVEIMLVMELEMVGYHMDADGDRRLDRVHTMDTLRDMGELTRGSSAFHPFP